MPFFNSVTYSSKYLKTTNMFILADLMKNFMKSQFFSFIPYLFQEVVAFKSFIKGYVEELVKLKEMQIFKFFVHNNE